MLDFIILGAATWRVSSLLAHEHGPWDALDKFRRLVGVFYDANSKPDGKNVFAKGLICVWCNSVWVGIGWAILYVAFPWIVWLAFPFALSAFAVTMECINGKS